VKTLDPNNLDWSKGGGLLPAVVQDVGTAQVLMLGYMNVEALTHTQSSGLVTFYSRSKQRLWTKGERSGHVLELVSLHEDCDHDTILVLAQPRGPTCHTGTRTCFGEFPGPPLSFLGRLEALIEERYLQRPAGSYTTTLFERGVLKMAQKVGEEGVETALAGAAQDDVALSGEAADLLFHLLVLLRGRGLGLQPVLDALIARHGAAQR
jgi:phosphoribosyl-ATP pyrophosphohydrolase/phosphoribosyl-AMP cyclohydrolase